MHMVRPKRLDSSYGYLRLKSTVYCWCNYMAFACLCLFAGFHLQPLERSTVAGWHFMVCVGRVREEKLLYLTCTLSRWHMLSGGAFGLS